MGRARAADAPRFYFIGDREGSCSDLDFAVLFITERARTFAEAEAEFRRHVRECGGGECYSVFRILKVSKALEGGRSPNWI